MLVLRHVDHGWRAAGQAAFQGGHEISVLLYPLAVRAEHAGEGRAGADRPRGGGARG